MPAERLAGCPDTPMLSRRAMGRAPTPTDNQRRRRNPSPRTRGRGWKRAISRATRAVLGRWFGRSLLPRAAARGRAPEDCSLRRSGPGPFPSPIPIAGCGQHPGHAARVTEVLLPQRLGKNKR